MFTENSFHSKWDIYNNDDQSSVTTSKSMINFLQDNISIFLLTSNLVVIFPSYTALNSDE